MQNLRDATKIFASIDLGTNTVRLLVAESDGEVLKPLYSDQVITRLGEGLSKNGFLMDRAMERTIAAVINFKKVASGYNPSALWVSATSAVREAQNRNEFKQRIERLTGLELEVIPWEEEARRTLLGVFSGNLPLPLLRKEGGRGRSIIFDIGGGSTEFIFAIDKKMIKSFGTDLGVVHLAEKYIKSDPVDEEEFKVMEKVIEDKVKIVRDEINSKLNPESSSGQNSKHLIGTAGTVTTLAALDLNLNQYDSKKVNNYILKLEKVKLLLSRLKTLTLRQRRDIPPLERGREDLIIPGTVIVIKTMEIFEFSEMIVSDYGLREGIILAKMNIRKPLT
ncbi:MAG: Ppx/GppA family phosphatase [Nitrospinae bacterium]|nr:Ppx/GppA family phosphatase [Nitrospinota bacterium]